ncbi:hypothetical protein FPQ18DRAFT_308716 [Pyronema domesticum]|nr:hypothetical protein FPQ18DRAFT_308716 [Pyronema domesticum]
MLEKKYQDLLHDEKYQRKMKEPSRYIGLLGYWGTYFEHKYSPKNAIREVTKPYTKPAGNQNPLASDSKHRRKSIRGNERPSLTEQCGNSRPQAKDSEHRKEAKEAQGLTTMTHSLRGSLFQAKDFNPGNEVNRAKNVLPWPSAQEVPNSRRKIASAARRPNKPKNPLPWLSVPEMPSSSRPKSPSLSMRLTKPPRMNHLATALSNEESTGALLAENTLYRWEKEKNFNRRSKDLPDIPELQKRFYDYVLKHNDVRNDVVYWKNVKLENVKDDKWIKGKSTSQVKGRKKEPHK